MSTQTTKNIRGLAVFTPRILLELHKRFTAGEPIERIAESLKMASATARHHLGLLHKQRKPSQSMRRSLADQAWDGKGANIEAKRAAAYEAAKQRRHAEGKKAWGETKAELSAMRPGETRLVTGFVRANNMRETAKRLGLKLRAKMIGQRAKKSPEGQKITRAEWIKMRSQTQYKVTVLGAYAPAQKEAA
jgi:hypothetical protein